MNDMSVHNMYLIRELNKREEALHPYTKDHEKTVKKEAEQFFAKCE